MCFLACARKADMDHVAGVAKLKRYIGREGLTQSGFAVKAKVPGPQVSLWLSGQRRPSITSALKIQTATAGEVTVADWALLRRRRSPSLNHQGSR
jgi:transcriptional regulator with XRE-family HTH domain